MEKSQIISAIQSAILYFNKRREIVFDEIQLSEQILENLQLEIQKNQAEIRNQITKEKQESNIFNLYNTTQPFTEEKNRLNHILEKKENELAKITDNLTAKKQELELINQNIISHQLLLHHFTNTKNNQTEDNTQKENTQNNITDFTSRLELIYQLIDLDHARCKLELQKLIEESK